MPTSRTSPTMPTISRGSCRPDPAGWLADVTRWPSGSAPGQIRRAAASLIMTTGIVRAVARVKHPAPPQRDLQGVEISRAAGPELRPAHAGLGARHVPAFDREHHVRAELQRQQKGHGGRTHARHRRSLLRPAPGTAPSRAGSRTRLGQGYLHRQDVFGHEAWMGPEETGQALHQEERTNDQHEREGHFAGHESAPRPTARPADRAIRPARSRRVEVRAGRQQRGQHPGRGP